MTTSAKIRNSHFCLFLYTLILRTKHVSPTNISHERLLFLFTITSFISLYNDQRYNTGSLIRDAFTAGVEISDSFSMLYTSYDVKSTISDRFSALFTLKKGVDEWFGLVTVRVH